MARQDSFPSLGMWNWAEALQGRLDEEAIDLSDLEEILSVLNKKLGGVLTLSITLDPDLGSSFNKLEKKDVQAKLSEEINFRNLRSYLKYADEKHLKRSI